MTYENLEKIATLLYGKHWKIELANHFGKTRAMAHNWQRQGVPDWVLPGIERLIKQRTEEIIKASEILKTAH